MKIPIDSHFVHEISQLDSIRQQAHKVKDSPEAFNAAASQFEALFMQMLFKSMRKANEVFESSQNSHTSKFYRQLADEQLASELANQGSLGLTELIVDQFRTRYQNNDKGE